MDRQAHIDVILDHYENPRHFGFLSAATSMQTGVNPGCGDVVTFYLRVGPDERVSAITFEGEGCTVSQAAASMVAEMFAGRTLAHVAATSPDAIFDLIGHEIASTRLKCAMLGLNTAKEAARAARRRFRDADNV